MWRFHGGFLIACSTLVDDGCVPSFVSVCLCKLLLLVSAHVACDLPSICYEVKGSFFNFWPIYTFDGALES